MLRRQLDIQVEQVGNVSVVSLSGAIDPTNVEDFKSTLRPLCAKDGNSVLLDCGSLSYVNSASIGLLSNYHRICATNNGELALCCVWDKIQNILRLLGLDCVLKIHQSREDALEAMK